MRFIIHRVGETQSGGPTIDMTPEGEFRTPPPMPWSARILRYAIVVAAIAGALAVAALALWFALMLIPVAIGAALVAYGVLRWRMWKAGRAYRGPGPTYRP